jgi:predicted hotdog family 3-hydroxylacyl-ACP dehydratase
MNNAEFTPEGIEQLIPHRLPMRLVESIARVEDESIETVSTVRDTWPTARDGHVRALMLVELIAQTAAVLQGWNERREGKTAIGGLLVGIPNADPCQPRVPVGTRLVCTVRISHGAPNYLAFDGQVTDTSSVLWLSGSVQAFRPDPSALPGE